MLGKHIKKVKSVMQLIRCVLLSPFILNSKISKYRNLKKLNCCCWISMCLAMIHTVASSFMQSCVAPWKFNASCNSNLISSTHKRINSVPITKGNTSLSRQETFCSKVEKNLSFLNKEILAEIVLNQSKNVVGFLH